MKKCSYCKTEKPFIEFNLDRNTKTGYSYSCKQCRSAHGKRYVKNNPNAVKATHLRKYGLTFDEYNTRLSEQNSKCDICKEDLDLGKHTCVDHCHTTGKTRGILCRKCNTVLGQAKDSTDILKSAILYLNKHAKKEAA